MNIKSVALNALLVVPLLTHTAQAQAISQADALTRLLTSTRIEADWFTPDFLKQAPLSIIQAQLDAVRAQYGNFVRLENQGGQVRAVYERGSLIVTSAPLDAQGRLASFGAAPGPSAAPAPLSPEAQARGVDILTALMAVDPLDVALFSPEFLAAVPEAQLRALFADFRRQLGAFQNAAATGSGWQLNFAQGHVPVTSLFLNPQGQIAGLRLGAPSANITTLDAARTAFASLPGEVSVYVAEYVAESGRAPAPRLSLNTARPLGVASTFKLAILGEVQARVNAGTLRWTDEVTLTDAAKSLPSGTLQDAPAGSNYTVQDLATRMIRDSDNTATDLLLDLAGRAGVEARLGQPAIPSTREAFALKKPANLELLRAYRAAGLNTAARRTVLKEASTAPLPEAADFDGSRTLARDVEWFVSTERLCRLMNDVAALPLMQVNPGVASKEDYARVSYKGGSEPGVMNLTTQVTNKAGTTYCVSATWNDGAPLNEATFLRLYRGLLDTLR